MKKDYLVASIWPIILTLLTSIIFLVIGKYDESSGVGSVFVLILLPIFYLITFVFLLLVEKILDLVKFEIARLGFLLFLGAILTWFFYKVSNGSGSDSPVSSFFISLFVASILLYPMIILRRYFHGVYYPNR